VGSRWQRVGGVERPSITSPIANPAPIEHGLVMDYTVGDALGLRRSDEPVTFAQPIIARSMRILAANLATAGALEASYLAGERCGQWHHDEMDLGPEPWASGCGWPMPGWER